MTQRQKKKKRRENLYCFQKTDKQKVKEVSGYILENPTFHRTPQN